MKDRSLIEIIKQTLIALTATAIKHCLLAWKTRKVRVPPGLGPRGGAQWKCNWTNNNHMVNNACTDVFYCLHLDFHSSLPDIEAKKIQNICRMIRRRIHWTGSDSVVAESDNDQGRVDEEFLDYVPEKLTVYPDKFFNCLSSFLAATEASMQFSVVRPMGGSAITSSS